MPIAIACPSCGHRGQAPDHCAGQVIRCPKCREKFRAAVDNDQTVALDPLPIVPQSPPEYLPSVPTPSAPVALMLPDEPQRFPCPFCSELILPSAKKCKHCGEILDLVLRAAEETRRAAERPVPVPAASQPTASVTQTVLVQQKDSSGCLGGCMTFIVMSILLLCGFLGLVQLIGSRSPQTFRFKTADSRSVEDTTPKP